MLLFEFRPNIILFSFMTVGLLLSRSLSRPSRPSATAIGPELWSKVSILILPFLLLLANRAWSTPRSFSVWRDYGPLLLCYQICLVCQLCMLCKYSDSLQHVQLIDCGDQSAGVQTMRQNITKLSVTKTLCCHWRALKGIDATLSSDDSWRFYSETPNLVSVL